MKTIALTTAAFLISAGAAFAENPNLGIKTDGHYDGRLDHTSSAAISIDSRPANNGSHPADLYEIHQTFGR